MYRLKKYRDTNILQYFVTSSIVDSFCKKIQPCESSAMISPIFFAMYINDIVCKLSASGCGCHVAGIYVGVLMYTDDMLLISSACNDLHRMTKMCG